MGLQGHGDLVVNIAPFGMVVQLFSPKRGLGHPAKGLPEGFEGKDFGERIPPLNQFPARGKEWGEVGASVRFSEYVHGGEHRGKRGGGERGFW